MTDSSANPRNYGERPLHEDDPLMELSRIVDFGTPQGDHSAWNERQSHDRPEPDFDPALDLERELLGDFDDYAQPTSHSQPVEPEPEVAQDQRYSEQYYRGAEPLVHEEDLASALEEELDLHLDNGTSVPAPELGDFEDVERTEPVQQFDYADYSSARDSFGDPYAAAQSSAYDNRESLDDAQGGHAADHRAYDPTIYQPAIEPHEESYLTQTAQSRDWDVQAVEPATPSYGAEPAHQSMSLEDELENLLFGDEPQPAAENDSAYGYQPEPVSYAPQAAAYEPEQAVSYAAASDHAHAAEEEVEPAFDDFQLDELHLDEQAFEQPHQPVAAAPAEEAVARTEPSGYPYYTRGNFASGIVAQMPTAAALPVGEAETPYAAFATPEQASNEVAAQDDDFSFDNDFSFDAAALSATTAAEGTDDDLSDLDELSLSDDDFGFEPSGDYSESEVLKATDEELLGGDDFFNEDDLDLHDDNGATAAAPAYAHAVLSDEDYRPTTSMPHFASAQQAASAPAPDVETLSVAENKVEQTHSLDLPEVNYGEEETAAGLGDLEAEFAEVFNTVGVDELNTPTEAQSEADKAFEDIFRESASSYLPNAGVAAGATAAGLGAAVAAAASSYGRSQPRQTGDYNAGEQAGSEDDFYNHWAAQGAQTVEGGDYGARAAMQPEDDLGKASEAYRNRPVRGRRGLILASVAGAVVLLGGIGYHFMGGGSQEPVVIHADNQPIKMQPENPGGATVPNQDKAVYDRVAGTLPNNPEQKSLINSGEEPVDISGTDDNEAMTDTPDSSAENGQANAGAPNGNAQENAPLIQPREVETMIVRPDGTIMQPERAPEPAAQQTANNGAQPSAQPSAPAGGDEIAAIASGSALPEPSANAPQAQQPAAQAPVAQAPAAEAPRLPARAPVVPSRPAEQPVNIVGNVPQRTQTQAPAAAAPVANQQVASAAGGAAGAGGYFIQIASQPSAELAQKSYANMAQKYANVIGGRGVDIKPADIPGRGTYYRVRVQAGSRDDANALCGRLKSAGGSCLVTR
ncbi:SPOR domain-containing protein [Ochrobactrum sp. RH2CCR150]|uniref:SPOR domain-containing protein n=1 Tax=Ochrobactrum sp. RH2CCR150 TaxID=2587044 RepID=UPI0015FA80E0|nr:hypothetical protein [Ochrobactrum sp. RH2CCR150]